MEMTIKIPSLYKVYHQVGDSITVNGAESIISSILDGYIVVQIPMEIYKSSDLGAGF